MYVNINVQTLDTQDKENCIKLL